MNYDSEVTDDGDGMNNSLNKENHDGDDDDDNESNDDCTDENNQSLEEGYSQNIAKPSMSIDERKKKNNNPKESQSVLETQSVLSRKQQGRTPKNNKNTGYKERITRYLSTKGRDQDNTNNTNDTPKQQIKNPNVEKSPVTPTENLHDATRDARKPKKKR
ncbi:putative neugrin-like protein DDB_G0288135 [Mytilus edulis]|uniref:putative neugrin-like protein DDB_G0288135 n=1 Tax=Mytilus edulis TaxID=6550 RepID=UPI0039EE2EB3